MSVKIRLSSDDQPSRWPQGAGKRLSLKEENFQNSPHVSRAKGSAAIFHIFYFQVSFLYVLVT